MKSADSFDGNNLAVINIFSDLSNRAFSQDGTALVTADGLSMKTAVIWIIVLFLARLAEWKSCHRSVRAIIRDRFDNRETWATVSAVSEGVVVVAASWVKEFINTGGTGRGIGGYFGCYLSLSTLSDGENS